MITVLRHSAVLIGGRRYWLLLLSPLLWLAGQAVLLIAGRLPTFEPVYGAAQAAAFYMVTAMGLGSLFRSETAGALGTTALLGLEASPVGAVARTVGLSPFWNPLAATGADAEQLLAMAVRNRIGTALAIAAIIALTFARAERRERMLGA